MGEDRGVPPGATRGLRDRFAVPPPPPPFAPADEARSAAVLRGLARLARQPAGPLGQGLGEANAHGCLGLAIGAIGRDGLARELATPGARPESVALVCAYGVFTSPIEWAALFAAAGARVHLKAPSAGPELAFALAAALSAEGLPVAAYTSRALGRPDALVAFGEDEHLREVAATCPGARRSLYGHRFSLVLLEQTLPQVLAWEAAWYDTRGCMAPAAVLTLGDPAALARALAPEMEAVERVMPRGAVDPALGPEWRRRVGLARARGLALTGSGYAVLVLPPEHFTPVALPRMLTVHPVSGPEEAWSLISPWKSSLSSLATDDGLRPLRDDRWAPVYDAFPRLCPLGTLQRPAFPRLHDGRPMLGSVLG